MIRPNNTYCKGLRHWAIGFIESTINGRVLTIH